MGASFHITVIAKEPVAGRVKTRLVPPLSYEQAADIARACLADTFDAISATVRRCDDVRAVALIDGEAGPWIPEHFEIAYQRGDGLGDRLANGFDDLGPGLIVGMDTPTAGRWYDQALAALRVGEDAVGLTHDGGYWGIALAVANPAVFDGVPMSTDRTGRIQLEQLDRIGRTVRLMPTVHDLDDFGDLGPIVRALPGSHLAAAAANLVGPSWG